MKKITILVAIAALVAGVASCNKIEKNNTDSGIKVNIAVSDLTPGTKAIKSGWSDGDIINVYLDDASSYVPDFQLTYSGGSWNASAISADVEARLKTSGGTLQGFWEGSNSAISGSGWDRYGRSIEYDISNNSTTGKVQHLTASFADIAYTFDGTTVTASLDTWYFRSNIQVVVTGLPDGKYALYGDPYDKYKISIQDFNMFTIKNNVANMPSLYGLTASDRRIAGIANEDGIAFVGALSKTEFHTDDQIVLHLVQNAGSSSETHYICTKTLTNTDILLTDGTAYGNNKKVYAAKVPFSAFTAE